MKTTLLSLLFFGSLISCSKSGKSEQEVDSEPTNELVGTRWSNGYDPSSEVYAILYFKTGSDLEILDDYIDSSGKLQQSMCKNYNIV